jgi:sulfur-oxidizing protein SoxY
MTRRKILGLGLGVAAMIPFSLSAVDFRATKPKAFTVTTIDEAITTLFGTSATTESGMKIKAPDIAENGGVIPISVSTKLKAKTVAIFQDANKEATVAVFTVPENGIIDYSIRIRMGKTGKVTVVANVDGKLYSASKTVKVTMGGCGG